MCTNFVPSARHEIAAARLGVLHLPPAQWPEEVFPGSLAPILVRGDASHGEPVRCIAASFGLVPHWCKDGQQAKDMARKTYNARSETASDKPSFRHAWHSRQWALAPMSRFFEPCWEDATHNGGRSVRWQVTASNVELFAVAGLWEVWHNPFDQTDTTSFTLLTVNADGHPIMGRLHRPDDEKRMPVIVAPGQYAQWLNATPANAMQFMQPTPAHLLRAQPAPREGPAKPINMSLF